MSYSRVSLCARMDDVGKRRITRAKELEAALTSGAACRVARFALGRPRAFLQIFRRVIRRFPTSSSWRTS